MSQTPPEAHSVNKVITSGTRGSLERFRRLTGKTPENTPTYAPCTSCGNPVPTPDSVLCETCLEARLARRLLPFDPDRRRRTELHLAGRSCDACGWSWWQVSPRGDARCMACAELAAGRTPRCATCQQTTGWVTVDGVKRCGCTQEASS